jgi:hypothetical protein
LVGNTHLVIDPIFLHPLSTLGIQIIAKDKTPLLGRWNRERSDTGHNIRDDLARLEKFRNQSIVFM